MENDETERKDIKNEKNLEKERQLKNDKFIKE